MNANPQAAGVGTAAALFAANERLALWLAGKLWRHLGWRSSLQARGHDFDDVRQVALFALWRAAATFDPARGFKFSTMASPTVWRAIEHLATTGRPRFQALPPAPIADHRAAAAAEDADAAELAGDRLAKLLARLDALPVAVRATVERLAAGVSQSEIAAADGASAVAVRERVYRARRLIRKFGLAACP
jgi:RNA polymerase sigma factor (sigma-70 family)